MTGKATITETTTREDFLCRFTGDIARSYIADRFPKYAQPTFIARFMARYEVFKKILDVCGSIIDCGTGEGDSAMTWLQLSRILEPRGYYQRLVFCFDTFSGFPNVHEKDGKRAEVGDMHFGQDGEELAAVIRMHDNQELMFGHQDGPAFYPKFERITPEARGIVVKGDFKESGPGMLKAVPSMVVALLSLDFDLYEPTKLALEIYLPRMPKGAVILFDELNHTNWPGETLAALETVGLRNLRLQRFTFEPAMSYAVLE